MRSQEQRLESLEAAAFRDGRDLADIKQTLAGVVEDTQLLPGMSEKISNLEAASVKTHAGLIEVKTRLDSLETKVDSLGRGMTAILRHFEITST